MRVLRKVFSKNLWFIRCRRKHLQAVELSRYSRFTFVENAIGNSPKVTRITLLVSNELFCFISICKFGTFKNPFAIITSLSELYFRSRRFIILVQTKKVIYELRTMTAAQATQSHRDGWGLTWHFLWGIYTSIPTWHYTENSLAPLEAPSLNINSH